MARHIPTYELNNLSEKLDISPDVLLLSEAVTQVKDPLIIPHRTNYYGIGVCISGEAKLTANLETYDVIPGCLIAMSPHIIKQWHYQSYDFRSLAVLFNKDFMSVAGDKLIDQFPFFESVARHIFLLTTVQADNLKRSLQFIQDKSQGNHNRQDEMLEAFITGLLFEAASLYDNFNSSVTAVQTRSQLLASDFKKLVNLNYLQERSVSFYADRLFITPGHLTETVREVTGKTPGEWIAEAVVLEACVLLKNPALTITQVADTLHFPDQSSFGKYFKNLKGISPVAYRQG